MKPTRRRFATRWKLLIVPVAAVLAGLAIAVPASLASTGHAARSVADERPTTSSAATAGSGCHVTYTATTWPGQFTAEVTLTNRGTTTIDGWKLTFELPGDQAISSAWNATFTQTGHSVLATNSDYFSASIPPGASRSLGFLGTWQSDDTAATNFGLNGTACT